MENCKDLFTNLEQRYELDFIRFCSQNNNVSQSFTLFRMNDGIHQIAKILDLKILIEAIVNRVGTSDHYQQLHR